MILDAVGDSMVYVNGEPHRGRSIFQRQAASAEMLKQGTNQILLAHAGRGGAKGEAFAPASMWLSTPTMSRFRMC